MKHQEKHVFTLVSRATRSRYPVLFWADYGVVAPLLWTTNGAIGVTAELCAGAVAKGSYVVEDSALDERLDFTDQAALSLALRAEFVAWNDSVRAQDKRVSS